MTPIIFAHIARMSDAETSDNERHTIAQKVLNAYGSDGLVTLWACQNYYMPCTEVDIPDTEASAWWLSSENLYARMVSENFAEKSCDDARKLLKMATHPPIVSLEVTAINHSNVLNVFAPQKAELFSHSTASTVRQLAQTFFPQYPEFSAPQCTFYLDTTSYHDEADDLHVEPVHRETLAAFSDDVHALQYLFRVHESDEIRQERITPDMTILLAQNDSEWKLLDSMGIDPKNAYHILKGRRAIQTEASLPEAFSL